MKKPILILISLLAWSMTAGMIGTAAQKIGVSPYVAQAAFLVVSVVLAMVPAKQTPFVYKNDEFSTIWLKELVDRLWMNNGHLRYATDEDKNVIGGSAVYIPQPGALPTTTKNRNTYPATVVRRTDNYIFYPLDEYTTEPSHIPVKEILNVGYDKRGSMIQDHFGVLISDVGTDAIYKWGNLLPSSGIRNTSGAAVACHITGQTGNRLALTPADLKRARTMLNKQNIPMEGRIAIIDSEMLDQLTDGLTTTQYRDFSREYDAKTGAVGQLFGFSIVERSKVGISLADLDGSSRLQAIDYDTAVGATDNAFALCYHPIAVSRALGERKLFNNENRAEYYGDVDSALVRFGGRRRREDNAGVIAIVQTAA